MTRFQLFFPTSIDNIENIVTCKKSGEAFVENLMMTLNRIDCEKETEVFIDLSNKNKFLDDYKTLEGLLDIRIGACRLGEVINSFIYANSIKTVIKDVKIDYRYPLLNSFVEIDSIFKKINKTRILNKKDFRHCENHRDHLKRKSPLVGGINGFDNAEYYLPSAIGDAKTNRKVLINIDKRNHNFHIRYEDEGFNNQFHAFHMVINQEGQYVIDDKKIALIKKTHKGIPRAFKLIAYRHNLGI